MTLRFTVLGFELARLELDTEQHEPATPWADTALLKRGVRAISKEWMKRMVP